MKLCDTGNLRRILPWSQQRPHRCGRQQRTPFLLWWNFRQIKSEDEMGWAGVQGDFPNPKSQKMTSRVNFLLEILWIESSPWFVERMRFGVPTLLTAPWLERQIFLDFNNWNFVKIVVASFASCESNCVKQILSYFTFLKSLLAYFLHHQTQPKTV